MNYLEGIKVTLKIRVEAKLSMSGSFVLGKVLAIPPTFIAKQYIKNNVLLT